MKNTDDNIRRSLQRRQKALDGFRTRKAAFKAFKNEIIKDIEEARSIWKHTLEQLPDQKFN